MSGGTAQSLPDVASLRRGSIRYFPVVPGKHEFAAALRSALLAAKPKVVAVELPAALENVYLRAVRRFPSISVICYAGEEEHSAVYVPVEPGDPFVEAIRTAREIGAETIFLDHDPNDRPHTRTSYPDTFALQSISLDRYIDLYRLFPRPQSEEDMRRASGIAWKLQGCDPTAETVAVLSLDLLDSVLAAMEIPQSEPSGSRLENVELFHPTPNSLAEITTDYPKVQEHYELTRSAVDRRSVDFAILRDAEKLYSEHTGEKVQPWQRRALFKYSRKLAVSARALVPSLFDLTVASRSVVDDNYAWEVWLAGGNYRFQQEDAEIPAIAISGDEVWINTRKIRLRRRVPNERQRAKPRGLKPRPVERRPGEWAAELNGANICSYPPEDVIIEGFGHFLKNKGKSILSEERTRTEPFTTSLLDGVDLRETIRNWYERRIYVRDTQKVRGEVGSVIVIFDEDRAGRYEYMSTWLGEHGNESDMAFYSTFPFSNLSGPGIGRAEYGGLLMSLPAGRMHNIWFDPGYDLAENKPERLLLAGIDYSVDRLVVYVAAKPPRPLLRSIAARAGRQIVYIPIGQLSPTTLKKIRVVHVLDGHDKRAVAREYIW